MEPAKGFPPTHQAAAVSWAAASTRAAQPDAAVMLGYWTSLTGAQKPHPAEADLSSDSKQHQQAAPVQVRRELT